MSISFRNIGYDEYVGNIEIKNGKIIFATNEESVNSKPLIVEIVMNDIDKNKLKEYIKNNGPSQTIVIKTKDSDYKFEFSFNDNYKEFINILYKKVINT